MMLANSKYFVEQGYGVNLKYLSCNKMTKIKMEHKNIYLALVIFSHCLSGN